MISSNVIQQLAVKYQTTELSVWREYAQHIFLSYFYGQKGSEKILFKGGTALRILFGSPRFSEDLDFSSSVKSVRLIESLLLQAVREIEREGISIEVEEAKKTSGGYLAIIRFSFEKLMVGIRIEISFRKIKGKNQPVTIISDYIPSYTIFSLTRDELIKEKIEALLYRKKPRDFYDLYFILRARILAPAQKKYLDRISALVSGTKISFDKELRVFLPKSHHAIIRRFRENLLEEIRKN